VAGAVGTVYVAAGVLVLQPAELMSWALEKDFRYGVYTEGFVGIVTDTLLDLGRTACVQTTRDLFLGEPVAPVTVVAQNSKR
jgi:hypothetical protein